MGDERSLPPAASRTYDIPSLLNYDGPSFEHSAPIPGGVDLLDFRNSDDNATNISILLSALGIPFVIQRIKPTWNGAQARMAVTVPMAQAGHAMDLLNAAVKVGAVEAVPGVEGIIGY